MAKRRKRRLKKGPVLVLLLLIVLLVVYFYTHTNKYLFDKGFTKTYNNLINTYEDFNEKYFPYSDSDYYSKTDTKIAIKTNEKDTTISFLGDLYLTSKDNYFDLDLEVEKDKYNLEMLSRDEQLYYKIDDTNFYNTSFSNNNYSMDVFKDLVTILKKSINGNIKGSNLVKEKEKITISDKEYNSKKITLNIDEKTYNQIIISFLNNLKEDASLLEKLLSFGNYTSKEELLNYIKTEITHYETALEKSSSDKIISKVSLYFKGSKVLRTDIELLGEINYKISYINYNDYFEISYSENDQNSSYIKVNSNKIDIFIDGLTYGSGTYDDNSFKINFTDYSKTNIGHINYSYKDNKSNIDLTIDLDGIYLELISNNTITENKKLPNVDTSSSTSSSKMTSSDKAKFEKILKILN